MAGPGFPVVAGSSGAVAELRSLAPISVDMYRRSRAPSSTTDPSRHARLRVGPVHTGTTGPGVSAGEANSGCHGHREPICEIRSVLYDIVSIDDAGQHARTGGTVAVCALGELWRRG
jgi:hypothetical protein